MEARLCLEPWRIVDDTVELAATFENSGGRQRLWWRVPVAQREALTEWADPFVVGFTFPMMLAKQKVRVEGPVSPSLLENLETFMRIWGAWLPEKYRQIEIVAAEEVESPPGRSGMFVTSFSGGVDSCFTALRHNRGEAGRRNRKIGAAVVMNGFDIWPDQPGAAEIFKGLCKGTRPQLASLNMPGIEVAGNFHELPLVWGHAFGTHLIGGLRLFAGEFTGALIPNNCGYNENIRHWGSTPLTDRYLGSTHFTVIDDGGERNRSEKISYIAQSPELLRHLRVCFPADGGYRNCCRCEKCVRSIISFRIAGVPLPGSFANDATDARIAGMKFHSPINWDLWRDLLARAERAGMADTSWARALRKAVRRGRRRMRWQAIKRPFIPLRDRLRQIFRGSTSSRRRRKLAQNASAAEG